MYLKSEKKLIFAESEECLEKILGLGYVFHYS
jgi:hypothetical protein